MSMCVECSADDVEALPKDYLCQAHRDLLDGIRYCEECKKRYAPASEMSLLCSACADKQECEYCGKLYSEKYLLSRAKPKQRKEGEKQDLAYGVRFKGLCRECKGIAAESIPNTLENHMLVQCPECSYRWDVNLAKPLQPLFRD